MTLSPVTRLGVYEIAALIGEGGMGQVYRARDPKLQRDVAIKVLPDAVAKDAERLARFEREAQVLASLDHPHIGSIFRLVEAGHTHGLVLALVEWPTAAEIISGAGRSAPAHFDELSAP